MENKYLQNNCNDYDALPVKSIVMNILTHEFHTFNMELFMIHFIVFIQYLNYAFGHQLTVNLIPLAPLMGGVHHLCN